MIRAVFFDFYGTLAHWSPEAEGIQRIAAAEEGIDLDEASIARAYFTANAFMDAENARSPLRDRLPAEVDAFFAEYERLLLRTAGAETTLETAWRIWTRVRAAPKEMALYPDAKDALAELRGMGLKLGVISNVGAELDGWLDRLGVGGDLPVRATSGNTGVAKPHPAIFRTALASMGVGAREAVHVGDSQDSDVAGALRAGIEPVFVHREQDASPPVGVKVVTSLSQVPPVVRELMGANA